MIARVPKELTDSQINNIALSYDHSFGLHIDDDVREKELSEYGFKLFSGYTTKERERLIWEIKEIYRLIYRTLYEDHKLADDDL